MEPAPDDEALILWASWIPGPGTTNQSLTMRQFLFLQPWSVKTGFSCSL